MKLYLPGHDYKYAVEQIMLALFPGERPEYPDVPPAEGESWARVELAGERALCRVELCVDGRRGEAEQTGDDALVRTEPFRDRECQKIIKLAFYKAAMGIREKKPVWGALTGIRPGTLVTRMLEAGMDDAGALRRMEEEYFVSPERARLCLHTARASLRAAKELEPGDIALYVGIPFCPTRCAYCTFVSQSVEKSMKESFDLRHVREFCVEAGRPDTITAEKLRALRGVTRVSINPQSMSDTVLAAIGRRHSAEDIRSAYRLARENGGFEVNMDLIAGLPADTPETFDRTVEEVIAMAPENITVHTLALKKGSRITEEDTARPDGEAVEKMLDSANGRLEKAGYVPYYLYRQKYMSGGFENVGWAKPGSESLYNILIMEELCTILAMGGGGSTKLVDRKTGRIERIFDPKYPREYMENMDRIVADKEKIADFYRQTGGIGDDI